MSGKRKLLYHYSEFPISSYTWDNGGKPIVPYNTSPGMVVRNTDDPNISRIVDFRPRWFVTGKFYEESPDKFHVWIGTSSRGGYAGKVRKDFTLFFWNDSVGRWRCSIPTKTGFMSLSPRLYNTIFDERGARFMLPQIEERLGGPVKDVLFPSLSQLERVFNGRGGGDTSANFEFGVLPAFRRPNGLIMKPTLEEAVHAIFGKRNSAGREEELLGQLFDIMTEFLLAAPRVVTLADFRTDAPLRLMDRASELESRPSSELVANSFFRIFQTYGTPSQLESSALLGSIEPIFYDDGISMETMSRKLEAIQSKMDRVRELIDPPKDNPMWRPIRPNSPPYYKTVASEQRDDGSILTPHMQELFYAAWTDKIEDSMDPWMKLEWGAEFDAVDWHGTLVRGAKDVFVHPRAKAWWGPEDAIEAHRELIGWND